jgi:hypothetical protein
MNWDAAPGWNMEHRVAPEKRGTIAPLERDSYMDSEQFEKTEIEKKLRKQFGIPKNVQRVLIFGETSHWDPNWLYTSKEYYERRIEKRFIRIQPC